ncbi:TorD/DmsD family molecular chaperone [Neobacillus niacini]|uniref:TorD/DmsD family molecular chaperone n=1 Tax=Neobacillus niacini TaxID=86668 RepID=UPI00203CA13B|nr:molecular chaperone TorD family protein [Neobacillus niacini]MCM3690617.1 molecular chaperone TorD family protein [Neobacillus niacini]
MSTIESSQWNEASLLQNRLYINQFIRFIFDAPSNRQQLITFINHPQWKPLCEISEGFRHIDDSIQELRVDNGEKIKRLQEEYNRLFVGPNALPAPLWESVYLGSEHLLFEEVTLEVRKCYRQYGLTFIRESKEPDDHIVIELEFLSYLIQKTIDCEDVETKKRLLDDQYSFLNNHLLKWCPTFCELLSKATQFELYQGAALLLEEYLNLEKELIPALKEAL